MARALSADSAAPQSWPAAASRQAVMSIGQVLEQLRPQFPAVTVSKLRFLEDQGLITPQRAASGFRKYSQADVERLRFVLAAQRDHFWPLKVIKERLASMDAGLLDDQVPSARGVLAGTPARAKARLDARELADLTGASPALITELTELHLVVPTSRGEYTADAVRVVTAARGLAEFGIEPRHLRPVAQFAARQADLIERAVAPVSSGRSALARERAEAAAGEIAELLATLTSAVVRETRTGE